MAIRVSRQGLEVLSAGVGELRVSRQEVEVLAAGVGELRVSRQAVEVLHKNFFYVDVENSLNLSDTARGRKNFFASASSDLSSLGSEARPSYEANASSTLGIIQDLTKFFIPNDFVHLTSAMSLTQNLVFDAGLFQATSSNMTLDHEVSYHYPLYIGMSSWLELLDSASGGLGTPWGPVEIEHSLELSYVLNRTQDLTVNNTMNLADEGWWSEPVGNDLNFSQAAVVGRHKILGSVLDLESGFDPLFIFTRSLEHDSVVGHSLTYYLLGQCTDKQYIPFVGENTIPGAPTPPDDILPFVQTDASIARFVLSYPALAATENSVELRAPELDNVDRLAFNRINRETRGGKLTVFADPEWPKVQTIVATFIGLTKTEFSDLSDFLVTYIGKAIRMQDWEGREWIGVATMPNEAAIQDSKRGWTTSFEFEGVLTGSMGSTGDLNLGDKVGLEMEYARPASDDIDLGQQVTFLLV